MPDLSVGIHPANLMGQDEWPHAGSVDGGAKREGMPPGWEMHANAKHEETVGFLDFMAPMSPSSEADSIELIGGGKQGDAECASARVQVAMVQSLHERCLSVRTFSACALAITPVIGEAVLVT